MTPGSLPSHLYPVAPVLMNVVGCLDQQGTRALAKTSKYFYALFQTERMQHLLVRVHYPLSRPVEDGESFRLRYERLSAAHSSSPGITCCQTIGSVSRVSNPQLTPDGKKVVTMVDGGPIRLFDLETQAIWDLPVEHLCKFELASRGNILLTHRMEEMTQHIIDCVNLETGGVFRTFRDIVEEAPKCMQISSDEKYAYIAQGPIVKRLALETGHCEEFLPVDIQRESAKNLILAISRNGTVAISVSSATELLLWKVETGEILQILERPSSHMFYDYPLFQISLDQTKAIAYPPHREGYDLLFLWDLKTGKRLHQDLLRRDHIPIESINCAKVTPDLKHAVLGGVSGELVILDLETGKLVLKFVAHDANLQGVFNGNAITSLAIQPDGTSVVSIAKIWARTHIEIKHFSFSTLPEARLTELAQECRFLTRIKLVDQLNRFPQFAKEEILEAIAKVSGCKFNYWNQDHFEKGIHIHTALTVLPIIRGFLNEAKRDENAAPRLVSEAFARINHLPKPIRDAVWANFAAIHPGKPQFIEEREIDAGIDAINRTIREFAAQLQPPVQRPTPEGKKD